MTRGARPDLPPMCAAPGLASPRLAGPTDVTLLDLVDLDVLQRLQNSFAAATGVASIITLPDGTPLTDVIMPGMNGKRLAELVKERVPEVRVVFMSGYTADVIGHHGVLDPDVRLLEKPFDRAALLRSVRAALDA